MAIAQPLFFVNCYDNMLQRCRDAKSLPEGKQLHAHLIHAPLRASVILLNSLMNMYSRWCCFEDAHLIFSRMVQQNKFTWTTIIGAFARNGDLYLALALFQEMQYQKVELDSITFVCTINSCAKLTILAYGKIMHAYIVRIGCYRDVVLNNTLMDMYGKCGSIEDAACVFESMTVRDTISWNVVIGAISTCMDVSMSLKSFNEMQQAGIKADKVTFVNILSTCGNPQYGKWVHASIMKYGFESELVLGNALVDMYIKSSRLEDACSVFDRLRARDVVSWTTLATGCVQHNDGKIALMLFRELQADGLKPNRVTFLGILGGCAAFSSLNMGKHVHASIIKAGVETGASVGSAIVDMYIKCGSIGDAHRIFDSIIDHNVVLWNALLGGYAQLGDVQNCFRIFHHMHVKPDDVSIICLLNACRNCVCIAYGKLVHAYSLREAIEFDSSFENSLIDMYATCRNMLDAWNVFQRMHSHDIISWNTIIGGCAQHAFSKEALDLFNEIIKESPSPDRITFLNVANACASLQSWGQGKWIHTYIIQNGYQFDICIGNALVDMYSHCGSLKDSQHVFDMMPTRDVMSWNSIIGAHAQHCEPHAACEIFLQMSCEDAKVDNITLIHILNACANGFSFGKGKLFHSYMQVQHEIDVMMENTIVDMYCKSGSIAKAVETFDRMPMHNVVSWNALLGGYAHYRGALSPLTILRQMREEDIEPDRVTFSIILGICSESLALEQGRKIHNIINETGFEIDLFIGTALVDMYVKCGEMEEAVVVFHEMPAQSEVTWNALIAGYIEYGNGEEALRLFKEMQHNGMVPDKVTCISALMACSGIGAMEEGKEIHAYIRQNEWDLEETHVSNALLDMYMKLGYIDHACSVFNSMHTRDVISWTAMIAGYGYHGDTVKALGQFMEMQQKGVKPDVVTYVAILSACSYAGLLYQGYHYFQSMSLNYAITPLSQHYASMVSLLSRTGYLDNTKDFIDTMPFEPGVVEWTAFLNSCRVYGDSEMADYALKEIIALEPENIGALVLLSNIYAETDRWEDKANISIIEEEVKIELNAK